MLQIVGSCERRVFGLLPEERLARQCSKIAEHASSGGLVLLAHASVVLSDSAVAWLVENPATFLQTPAGRPIAIAVDPGRTEEVRRGLAGGTVAFPSVNPAQLPDMFIRKLRRRSKLFVQSLEEKRGFAIERELFRSVYKGITDVVTRYIWPLPAFWATKLCAALGIRPNVVTIVGIAAMFAAAVLWTLGEIMSGLLLAWLMTFLDTVDGKLARVTATSSYLGDKLDHITDLIHPPLWWICLAVGLAEGRGTGTRNVLLISVLLILVTYIVGRTVEALFKKKIGYNPFLWRPFDSAFRLVVSRRNIILLIITIGLVAGRVNFAYAFAAAWSVVSAAIQVVRYRQARKGLASGDARSWLM